MSTVEVNVPDIGDAKDVEVIEVLVKAGDKITVDQSLATLETDKASMEIPSTEAGVVKEVKLEVGDRVNQGSLVLVLEKESVAEVAAPQKAEQAKPAEPATPAAPAKTNAPAPASAGSSTVEVTVPDIGDAKDVEVIELLVKEGDAITVDQSLATLETDKASMEIPSTHAGVVKQIRIKVGDRVNAGSVVLLLQTEGSANDAAESGRSAPASAPAAAEQSAPSAAAAAPVAVAHPAALSDKVAEQAVVSATTSTGKAHASPSVRRFARELGIDVAKVSGTGPKGRIMQFDIQQFVKQLVAGQGLAVGPVASARGGSGVGLNLLPWPSLDFSKFGETTLEPLSRIKKLSGPNLHRNWVMIPHVTQYEEADVTDLEQFRKESNDAYARSKSATKLTMLAFVIKASVAALKKFPAFNASLDANGENLVLKHYYNIGFAADTPNGLVVPVLKNADQKGLAQIAQEMGELSAAARDGKLKSTDMQGATFTISSLGGIGGTAFTPIINAPEVAILGLSKSSIKPVWDGKQFVPRLMLPLSLSYDHRVVDGATAARFAVYLGEVLGDLRKVLL